MAEEKQLAHSNKIAAERVLMDAFGVSRNQLRQSVKNSMTSFVDAFQARPVRERQDATISQRDTLRVEHPQVFRTPPFQPFGNPSLPAGDTATGTSSGGGGTTLPTAALGDMLYYDGSDWAIVAAPSGMTTDPVLRYNLSTDIPYWEEPDAGC